MYIYIILATDVCFNELSVSANESQGVALFTLTLTNPSSTNIMLRIRTVYIIGTGTGEVKII